MSDEAWPRWVIVPAHPIGDRVVLEVRDLADGTRVLPVFTSTAVLVAQLGAAQPWAVLELRVVREAMAAIGVGLVALDPQVGADALRWQREDLERLTAQRPAASGRADPSDRTDPSGQVGRAGLSGQVGRATSEAHR